MYSHTGDARAWEDISGVLARVRWDLSCLGICKYYLCELVFPFQNVAFHIYLQYCTAWMISQASDLISIWEIITSSVLGDSVGLVLVVNSWWSFSSLWDAVPLALRFRDVTLPGARNVKGFTLSYPGHTSPRIEHLLHTGRVESQTRRRRRHSQQWRFRSFSICDVSFCLDDSAPRYVMFATSRCPNRDLGNLR